MDNKPNEELKNEQDENKKNKEEEIKKAKKIKKYIRYGKIAYYFSRFVNMTMKIEIIKDEKFIEDKNYAYAFWHDKIFLPMVNMAKMSDKIVNMVSPSKDGQIVATALESYNYKTVRGSSNKDNIKSLVELIRYVKEGYSAGFAADGPRGPKYELKPGIIYLAKKTNIEIVPLGGAYSKKWIVEKAWDKFQFPKPFSKAVYIIGEPIKIPKDADIEEYRKLIENKLNEINEKAEKILAK